MYVIGTSNFEQVAIARAMTNLRMKTPLTRECIHVALCKCPPYLLVLEEQGDVHCVCVYKERERMIEWGGGGEGESGI